MRDLPKFSRQNMIFTRIFEGSFLFFTGALCFQGKKLRNFHALQIAFHAQKKKNTVHAHISIHAHNIGINARVGINAYIGI